MFTDNRIEALFWTVVTIIIIITGIVLEDYTKYTYEGEITTILGYTGLTVAGGWYVWELLAEKDYIKPALLAIDEIEETSLSIFKKLMIVTLKYGAILTYVGVFVAMCFINPLIALFIATPPFLYWGRNVL